MLSSHELVGIFRRTENINESFTFPVCWLCASFTGSIHSHVDCWYTFAFCHLHGQWDIVGIGLCLMRTREASIAFYLVHTSCICRIENNIAWVSILLFNDTTVTAPDDKIFRVNLYHEPLKQLFNCYIFYFLASSWLSYPMCQH